MKFSELGLDDGILESLSYMGFEDATPIQEEAIPVIMEGKDLIACAQTGTGKTAAFILPMLHTLMKSPTDVCKTLVIVPTRELALQIDQQVEGFSYFTNINSIAIYGGGGGQDYEQQKRALNGGAPIIVATPGKLISHLNMGHVKFDQIEFLILDEADRMLDMGFVDDIRKIISFLPKKRQSLLFSATMPTKIRSLASEILTDPYQITLALSKPAEGVLQAVYLVQDEQKVALIKQLIADKPSYKSILIFTSKKSRVTDITRALRGQGYDVTGISSDLDQSEREKVLRKFKAKRIRVLVGTDVVSRGIDIKDINLVINYDVPSNAEDYVHRVGRTARADTTGVALTLVNRKDMSLFHEVEQLIDMEITKLQIPKEIGRSPEWNPAKHRGPKRHGGGGKHQSRGKGNRSGGGRGKAKPSNRR